MRPVRLLLTLVVAPKICAWGVSGPAHAGFAALNPFTGFSGWERPVPTAPTTGSLLRREAPAVSRAVSLEEKVATVFSDVGSVSAGTSMLPRQRKATPGMVRSEKVPSLSGDAFAHSSAVELDSSSSQSSRLPANPNAASAANQQPDNAGVPASGASVDAFDADRTSNENAAAAAAAANAAKGNGKLAGDDDGDSASGFVFNASFPEFVLQSGYSCQPPYYIINDIDRCRKAARQVINPNMNMSGFVCPTPVRNPRNCFIYGDPEQGVAYGALYWNPAGTGSGSWPRSVFCELGDATTVTTTTTATMTMNCEWVADIYRTKLCRSPDSGGLSGWTTQCNQGMNRSTMENHFMETGEYKNCTKCKNNCQIPTVNANTTV